MYRKLECVGLLILVGLVMTAEMTKLDRRYLSAGQGIPETKKPVIGVLAQETSGRINRIAQGQYVLGTYVNLLESVGARVVPVLINQTAEQTKKMFNSINGLVLPGGHVELEHSMYGTVGRQLYDLAREANDKGDVFPIWAECLGLELIALLASGRGLSKGQYDNKLFEDVDARSLFLPLNLVGEWKKSKLFGSAPPDMVDFMTKRLRGYHNHYKAITMKEFKAYKGLADMFNVIAVNKDRKGKEYITIMEGKKYPFWLLHYHPSKAPPLWPDGYDDKTYQESITNAQYMYNIFMDEARKSKHTFSNTAELANLLISQYGFVIPMRDDLVSVTNMQIEK